MTERVHKDAGSPVGLLITLAAVAASVCVFITAPASVDAAREEPLKLAAFLALTLALQLFSVEVYGRGRLGASSIGILASAFALGPGPAIAIAILAALAQWVRGRGMLHKAIFDAANFSLAAAASGFVYQLLTGITDATPARFAFAIAAGVAYNAVNTGLLCLAMSFSESLPVKAVWEERYRWARVHYLASGPLAFATALAYEEIGVAGLVAFALPPALLMLSVRQYVERTRSAVEEVRRANQELRHANEQLGDANADLHELFRLAGGLAARAHDRNALIRYVEETLERVTGTPVTVMPGEAANGVRLVAGGRQVGSLAFSARGGFDSDRWERLRDALLPQLATAVESAELVERVKKTHLATIAALSRSMEAKDYYTGGHTERVAQISVALAERLGYSGGDLEAIEVGALLHDIGKIGIPEAILQKPGPLDEEEWRVMREHPVISDYILSEVDLNPIVRQVARSSHERIDGSGYPDGLVGADIPLPARIAAVADAFDALTSDRAYRGARSTYEALQELRRHAGTQFCPSVIDALEQVYRDNRRLLAPTRRLTAVGAA